MISTTIIDEEVLFFCILEISKHATVYLVVCFFCYRCNKMEELMKKYFQFEELGTNYRREIIGGLTTFLSYGIYFSSKPNDFIT